MLLKCFFRISLRPEKCHGVMAGYLSGWMKIASGPPEDSFESH